MKPNKVIVIGSGPIKIAEAAEFDYSGSQALKALREEGITSVLVNPNIATVQTSYRMADRVYLLPITCEVLERIIEAEKPDGILMGFGGQTALTVGTELHDKGILETHGVSVLGTGIIGIKKALSRKEFKDAMHSVGIETPRSITSKSRDDAVISSRQMEYPLIVRASFNLGGRGSEVVYSEEELDSVLDKTFAQSAIGEVSVEEYLEGWKEIEYEVVRDSGGNCAVTACIENLDPMGIHTGESVAVTPAQTLDNTSYQAMRSIAIRVAEEIGLVGECNVQFALDPKSYRFYVIETNPRMSRSSALASKATGYPLAYVSAKLALGHRLYEIANSVSKATTACFEPSLDYITVKMPRWNMEKFENATERLGTEMKSIGEVMGIGRNLEEAMQKAVRMLDIGEPGIVGGKVYNAELSKREALRMLEERKPYWFLYAAKALREGASIGEVCKTTLIDPFFIGKLERIVRLYELHNANSGDLAFAESMKRLGFSDAQLGVRTSAAKFVKQMDTLAGEWPASTNYLYTTHDAQEDDVARRKGNNLLVLGAGVFRIGVSVEFDWSAISLLDSASKSFDSVSLLNCNPETVSTDWDTVSGLYFDELTEETILGICSKGNFGSVAAFAAGQIGNNLAHLLEKKGVRIFGPSSSSVEIAENRESFSHLLERLGIRQPEWSSASSRDGIKEFVKGVGFPVLIRPSHVLSGSSMKIANDWEELDAYINRSVSLSPDFPVTVSRYVREGVEAEMDCASDSENVLGILMHHVEEAGVHSGDSTLVTPFGHSKASADRMKEISLILASELSLRGPFNIQFVIENGAPSVIEANIRASRSMPFSSKSVGINLIEHAVRGITGKYEWNGFREPDHASFAVKSPQFAWNQVKGVYPHLGPEMRSTGESAAFGRSFGDALVKSWLGVQPNKLPAKSVLVYGISNAAYLGEAASDFSKTLAVNTLEGASIGNLPQISQSKADSMLRSKKIDLVVTDGAMIDIDYNLRRRAAEMNVPLVLNGRLGAMLASQLNSRFTFEEMGEYWK